MSLVVLMSWDPVSGTLDYVPVNGGAGGAVERLQIAEPSASDVPEMLADVTLPRVAELLIDGADVLVGDIGAPAVLCSVRQAGGPGNRQFRLIHRGAQLKIDGIPAAELGFGDDALAGAAEKLKYLYVAELTPPGCWLVDGEGGIGEWIARRRRDADQEHYQRSMTERFINPYTFVPFPERIDRRGPAGHHLLAAGNLSGTLTVTWRFASPFQAPEGQSGTTVLRLPGSSVKGAVRSLHETLAGGCLRVFNDSFVPSYRDQATARSGDWTMALVEQCTQDGQPLTVRLCDDVCWVPAPKLRAACGQDLRTGSRVR